MSDAVARSAGRHRLQVSLADIAGYVHSASIHCPLAYDAARWCLMDALASGFLALADPRCARRLGPVVRGASMVGGARVPGTSFELDPARAAFIIGVMTRWTHDDDAWLATGCGHPADPLGGILAAADYQSRLAVAAAGAPPTVRDVLTAMIKAHELRAATAPPGGSAGAAGEQTALLRAAGAAVVTALLGGTREQVVEAAAGAWSGGGAPPAAGPATPVRSRKGWTVGEANSDAARRAFKALGRATNDLPARSSLPAAAAGVPAASQAFAYPPSVGSPCLAEAPVASAHGRTAAVPLLLRKFDGATAAIFPKARCAAMRAAFQDAAVTDAMPVSAFVALFVNN